MTKEILSRNYSDPPQIDTDKPDKKQKDFRREERLQKETKETKDGVGLELVGRRFVSSTVLRSLR